MADRSIVVYLRAQVSDFKRQMDEAGKTTKKVGEEAGKAASTATTGLGRLTESATKNREAWDRAGTTLTAFGAGAVAALGLSAKAAIDWESAWAGVTKTVDGTPEQLAALETGLRGLATTLPASHQEIAAVAEAAGQLGIETDNVLSFTKTMIDLGETTNLSADEAATAIARFTNVMGTSQTDVGRLGSTVVALGNNFATTEAEIVAMGQRLSAAGAIAGFTEPQVLGLATAMSSIGIEAEAGGSAMSQVIQSISKAVADGGKDVTTFAELAGMSATDFSAAWRSDPIVALDAVVSGLASMNDTGANSYATLDELGLSGIRQTAVLQGLATATGLTTEAVSMASEAWSENTALIEEAIKRYDTTEARLQIARNSINDAAISLGEAFLPAIASAAEGVASLAQWFAALPGPAQQAIGSIGGLVGVTSLLAGGFLLTFPRVLETVQAFRRLSEIAPTLTSGLGKVGRAAGIVGSAMAAMAASSAIPQWGVNTADGAGMAAQALLDVASGAQSADEAFASMFATGSFKDWFTGNDVDSIEKAFEVLKQPSVAQNVDNIASSVLTLGQNTSTSRLQAQELFDSIDQGLASLVQSGAADQAADALAALGIELEGNQDILPLYADSLAGADVQQQLAGDSASGMADGLSDLASATSEADEALQEWIEDVSGADAAFIDVLGALDETRQASRDWAEAQAAATSSAEDSWEDFYDGVSFSLDAYLDKLHEQVEAQQNWESNMILLSGRASQGVLDELARMGPEGAPLVQALLDGTDEQLAQFEADMAQGFDQYTNQWATNLSEAAPIIAAASAQLGAGAVEEIAAKLSDGVTTIDDVIREYGLVLADRPLSVPLNTDLALGQLTGLLGAINEATGVVTVQGEAGPAVETLDGLTAQVDESSGTVTIYGEDGEAVTTLSGFTAQVDASGGTVTIAGNDANGRATTVSLTNWVSQQGASIKVGADTSGADAAMATFRSRQAANALVIQARVNADPNYSPATTGGVQVGRASGGPVFGPGTETSDSINARLSHNEHVWSAAEVRGAGGHGRVAAMRAAARVGALPGFANGGSPGYRPTLAPTVNITAPPASMEGATLLLRIGDQEMRGYVEQVAQPVAVRTLRTYDRTRPH